MVENIGLRNQRFAGSNPAGRIDLAASDPPLAPPLGTVVPDPPAKALTASALRHQVIMRRRAEWFAINGPCRHCGSTENLELDHVKLGTKDPRLRVASIHVWAWKEADREIELAKCQALCKSCHRKKTTDERGGPQQHGKYGMYTRHGCRCEPCKQASAAAARKYRLENPEKCKEQDRRSNQRRAARQREIAGASL